MELDEEYPKMVRDKTAQLRSLLDQDPALSAKEREEYALAINDMADKACDLNEIFERLLNEPHTMAEVGELLIAFELTTEQIRGNSDVIDGKLYEIADRLKGVSPARKKAKGKPARR